MRKILTAIAFAMILLSCGNGGGNVPMATREVADGQEEADQASEDQIPQIKFLGRGSILPSDGGGNLLFSSTGYARARVRVKKIYSSNILQYMQFGDSEKKYNLYKVAGVIADTTIVLGTGEQIKTVRNYGLSLDELIKPEKKAIYHVEIKGEEPVVKEDYYDNDTYFGNYDTYSDRYRDLLSSDLAMVARKGDRDFEVTVFNILSGKPVRGARVKLYDFVQQEMAKGTTDGSGTVRFDGVQDCRFIVASSGNDFSYLDVKNEKSLSTSNFDVSGAECKSGLKAYVFGERGVWRPGDTLHITAVVMSDTQDLPADYPITAQLRNPDGQTVRTMTQRAGSGPMFHFPFATAKDDVSGRWEVAVNVGGQVFSKAVRVETVKPNKLDVEMKFDRKVITPDPDCTGDISVSWLYGAPGAGLGVDTRVDLSPAPTQFEGYGGYSFKDEARVFESQSYSFQRMTTDDQGKCRISSGMQLNRKQIPGLLKAEFNIRAYEPSGEFSSCYAAFTMSPFEAYVGISTELDRNSWDDEYLTADKDHRFDIVTLDADGKPLSGRKLRAEIYRVDWSWWWDAASQIASYMSGSSRDLIMDKVLSTESGKASFVFNWEEYGTGIYYVRVTDTEGGHAASMVCQVAEWKERSDVSDAAVRLNIDVNKDRYKVGETARLTIPSSRGSRAVISIQKGGRILSSRQIECDLTRTEILVPVTSEMLPNAYAFITLIQPRESTENDAPIRLYGVVNINVEDEDSHLDPQIALPARTKPESSLNFTVKEGKGRPMSYVVALVDEGLLSLTGFKTPDIWGAFYQKEALRVRTWDLYDEVIGAYGGRIEQMFAVGGDDESAGPLRQSKASRFTPVVRYLGPFRLEKGRTAKHTVQLPQYIGSLRAMVFASDGKAQGSATAHVEVSKPLMVQATLPRTLAVGETIQMPVTLFSMEKGIGDVKLSIKTDGTFKVHGPGSKTVRSTEEGQQVEYFELETVGVTGIGHVSVTAQSSTDKSSQDIEIDVFNPNPVSTASSSLALGKGESASMAAAVMGAEGSSLLLELSTLPSINLSQRLDYLLQYPYGCVEQTVSAAFPQLYLSKVCECSEAEQKRSVHNVEAAIARLQSYRRPDGSLSYWPGGRQASDFGSAYALHFLSEAQSAGYAVPADLTSALETYVTRLGRESEDLTVRAYSLFALALDGKPVRSAMNNMREMLSSLGNSACWLLAAAYCCDGKKETAHSIISKLSYGDDSSECFGSADRNRAIALCTYLMAGLDDQAFRLSREIASRLSDSQVYMSTQSTAWSLYAISKLVTSEDSGQLDCSVSGDAGTFRVKSSAGVVSRPLDIKGGEMKVALKNNSDGMLYATLVSKGIAAAGEEKAFSRGLQLKVEYLSESGEPVDVNCLGRGDDFRAVVSVSNTSGSRIENISLDHRFPSGWEIQNRRVSGEAVTSPADITYQDFRDDRVYSFFDLESAQTVRIEIELTATYPGHFYLPAISCSSMYDNTVSALVPGQWVSVE